MDTLIAEIQRRITRCQKIVEANKQKFSGREHEFTFHGGYDSGYAEGKLAALEDMLDALLKLEK